MQYAKASRMHIVKCISAHHEAQVLYAMWDWVLGVLSPLEVEAIVTATSLKVMAASYCNFLTSALVR
jgi:hypothetical protein